MGKRPNPDAISSFRKVLRTRKEPPTSPFVKEALRFMFSNVGLTFLVAAVTWFGENGYLKLIRNG